MYYVTFWGLSQLEVEGVPVGLGLALADYLHT